MIDKRNGHKLQDVLFSNIVRNSSESYLKFNRMYRPSDRGMLLVDYISLFERFNNFSVSPFAFKYPNTTSFKKK